VSGSRKTRNKGVWGCKKRQYAEYGRREYDTWQEKAEQSGKGDQMGGVGGKEGNRNYLGNYRSGERRKDVANGGGVLTAEKKSNADQKSTRTPD